jgi:hypothetical protein
MRLAINNGILTSDLDCNGFDILNVGLLNLFQ